MQKFVDNLMKLHDYVILIKQQADMLMSATRQLNNSTLIGKNTISVRYN